jgi:hypothetical protein
MPAIHCAGCRASSDPGDVVETQLTCPHCGKTLFVIVARVDRRRMSPSGLLVGAIGLAVAFVIAAAGFFTWWSWARHNPEHWTEQEMFEHLQAKGIDTSYQLCEGAVGYYLVKPNPGQNPAALVVAFEAGARVSGVVTLWRDTDPPSPSARQRSTYTFSYRGWWFFGRDADAVSEIRRCLEK